MQPQGQSDLYKGRRVFDRRQFKDEHERRVTQARAALNLLRMGEDVCIAEALGIDRFYRRASED